MLHVWKTRRVRPECKKMPPKHLNQDDYPRSGKTAIQKENAKFWIVNAGLELS